MMMKRSASKRAVPVSGVAPWVVFGLGRTGLSCARFLAARGCAVSVVDTRAAPPGLASLREILPGANAICGDLRADVLAQAEHVVMSPGVPLDHPAVRAAAARGCEIIGDIELFARHARAPIIGITGSNGKSTVTTLTAMIIDAAGHRVAAGANLGTPALDLLRDPEPDFYVLELSSFQLDVSYSLAVRVACILNISPDHLDRHHTFPAYVAAKARILRGATEAVLNADDPVVAALAEQVGSPRWVSLEGAGDYGIAARADGPWLARGSEAILPVAALKLRGRHNEFNALAAIAITDSLGLPRSAQVAVLREFAGLEHRCRLVTVRGGVSWFNDSKGTNVGAASAAVAGIFNDRPGVLIAGGQGKGADFRELRPALAGRVHTAILIGEDARAIAAAIEDLVTVRFARDMRDAVALAAAAAEPGESVLLSPACASFDMFRDYAARGRAFEAAVREASGP